jgi:agmatine deiminase
MDQHSRAIPRRVFLRYSLVGSTVAFLPNAAIAENLLRRGMSFFMLKRPPAAEDSPSKQGWFMPSEQALHKRCWMAWPAREDVWQKQLNDVRQDIARLAQAIASFEPVTMLAEPDQVPSAAKLCGSTVSLQPMSLDDTWFRDSGPIFLVNGKGGLAGSTFNFNGWGKKQVHESDARIGGEVLAHLGVPAFRAPFVTEGGALENDGEGTLLVVQASILNENRNPGKSRQELTEGLEDWLGVDKVLWLPDSHPDYWTDGHVDGVARFVKPGVVLVDQGLRETVEFLRQAQDAKGRKLQVIEVPQPEKMHSGATFCNCYLNFYFANGAVVMPQFGDKKADDRAHSIVAESYPQRKIYPIQLNTLASGGGLIHCVTQQEPAV